MSVKKLTTGPSAILLGTLEATALQYDSSQLSNAQKDLWPHPWRNVILFMPLSVHRELETRAARIIRRLPNDHAQTSRDYALSEMQSATLLICFILFAFLKPLLEEKKKKNETVGVLPVLVPKRYIYLHLAYLHLPLACQGGELECVKFTGSLVLQCLARKAGMHVFSRHVTKHGSTIWTLTWAKTASLNPASQPLSLCAWIRHTHTDLPRSMMLIATPAPILSGGFPSFLIAAEILTVAFKALYTYPLILWNSGPLSSTHHGSTFLLHSWFAVFVRHTTELPSVLHTHTHAPGWNPTLESFCRVAKVITTFSQDWGPRLLCWLLSLSGILFPGMPTGSFPNSMHVIIRIRQAFAS